jgi:hypothetical protein
MTFEFGRGIMKCATDHLQWYMDPRVRKDDYSFWHGGEGKLSQVRFKPSAMPDPDRVPILL